MVLANDDDDDDVETLVSSLLRVMKPAFLIKEWWNPGFITLTSDETMVSSTIFIPDKTWKLGLGLHIYIVKNPSKLRLSE